MKKTLYLLLLSIVFSVTSVSLAHAACKTNADCPGNVACNVSTGICATPSDPNGTGAGFTATPAAATPTPTPTNTADGTVAPGGQCTTDTNCQDTATQSYGCYPEGNGVCTLNGTAPTTATPAGSTSVSPTGNFIPLTNLPIFASGNLTTAPTLPAFFNALYLYCIGIAATLAVLQIMHAGILYMGGDSVTETKEARSLIASAVLGLVLVLSPVIVFSIINPKILNLDIGLSGLAPSPTAAVSTTPPATAGPAPTNCAAGPAYTDGQTIPNGDPTCCNAQAGYHGVTSGTGSHIITQCKLINSPTTYPGICTTVGYAHAPGSQDSIGTDQTSKDCCTLQKCNPHAVANGHSGSREVCTCS